jgi:hypothetical protein
MTLPMDEELRHLLERIFIGSHAADNPRKTILSLSKRDGELLLRAFNVRVIADYPSRPEAPLDPMSPSRLNQSISS